MRTEWSVRDQSDVIHNKHICLDAVTQVSHQETLDTIQQHTHIWALWVLSSLSVSTWPSITPDCPSPVCLFICLLCNRDGLHCNYTKSFQPEELVMVWASFFILGNDDRLWPNHCHFNIYFLANYGLLLYLLDIRKLIISTGSCMKVAFCFQLKYDCIFILKFVSIIVII